jgi:Zn-dependent protease with chaperone function
MSLVAVVQVGGPIALLLLSPWLAAHLFDRRAPARTVATFHLLALLGMAALPVVVMTCLLLVRPADLAALGSPHAIRTAQRVILALGVAYLLRLVWATLGARRATARLLAATTLAATQPLPAAGGPPGFVLAVRRPVAYALGGRTGRVVVSQGLLALLDDRERDAVIAHELAHVRLRHHRLLLFARVVRAALGKTAPAARRADASLARELEAIADEAAARAVGDRQVVARALAKTALAAPAHGPATAFNREQDLAYRIQRLTADQPSQDRGAVASIGVGLLAVSLVVTLGIPLPSPGLAVTAIPYALSLVGVGWLAWRGVTPVHAAAARYRWPAGRCRRSPWRRS